jgi:hypothetical protein
LDCACQRLFQLRLELPAEAELQRLVNAALNGYFYDLYEQMTAQLPLKVQTQLDELLVVPPDGAISRFERPQGRRRQSRGEQSGARNLEAKDPARGRSSSRGVPFHSLEGAPDAQAPSLE